MKTVGERAKVREGEGANTMDRRTALKVVASVPFAAAFVWAQPEVAEAHRRALAAVVEAATTGAVYEPRFFTPQEWQTVRMLSDLIIPRDERSGSATDVAVPEFMDFMMLDQPNSQIRMRAGLNWLDDECYRRYGRAFTECDTAQHTALLDQISWPNGAPEALADGVAFFVSFRGLVLTGFWTTKAGIDDLQYMGNTFVAEWQGCPEPALKKLGVSYDRPTD